MSTLEWDQLGDHVYEAGVGKGVFYNSNGSGVAWNGLTSIEETLDTEVEAVYFDGIKFNDIVTVGDFAGTIRAFTYPSEFIQYVGMGVDQTGFFVTGQYPRRFGMSYQTRVGDDISGVEAGYKIHVLYNLTATMSEVSHRTLSLDIEPNEFEWHVTAIPEEIVNFRPTAHIIIDSRKVEPLLLRDIEDLLYGSEENEPRLPSLQSLANFIRHWNRFIITVEDGIWTATALDEGIIVMTSPTSFEITTDTAVITGPDTYTISSSDKNEDDLWLQL